ncbi:MAG: hypothetical protein QM723_12370 [Myxococcaceae bacterium]
MQSITWLTPDGGNVFAASALVSLKAVVIQADGGAWSGNALPWSAAFAAGGQLTAMNGAWIGATNAPAAGGTYEVFAGWDGGPGKSTSFIVDTAGPAFTVAVQAAPTRTPNTTTWLPNDPDVAGAAYRRDEVATVVVSSLSADVDPSTVSLSVKHATEGSVVFTDGGPTNCAAPFCWAFQVDLSRIPMGAMRGAFDFTANGADFVGNPGDAGTDSTNVTRWQWAEQISQNTSGAVKATPALGNDGTIYVARSGGSPTGILAVSPDGGTLWEAVGMGNIEASPAIGRRQGGAELVFAQSTDNAGTLRSVDTGGSVGAQICSGTAGAAVSKASLVVMNDGTDEVEAIGVQPGAVSTNNIAALVPNGAGIKCPLGLLTVGASYPGNFVASGNGDGGTLYYPDKNYKIQPCTVSGASFSLGGETPSTALGVGPVDGLALYSASGTRIVGGGGPGIGKLFQIDPTSPTALEWQFGGGTTPAAGPVVTAANDVLSMLYVSAGNSELRTFSATGTLLVGPQPWAVDFSTSDTPGAPTPVLGADGAAYLLSNAGELLVADSTNLMTRYTATKSSAMSGLVLASPTLDCDRNHPSASAGVLYFVSDTGLLISYIVDAKGLDANAPWPKYQHDARNTGNTTTVIAPCP